jgi:hypothetical protein
MSTFANYFSDPEVNEEIDFEELFRLSRMNKESLKSAQSSYDNTNINDEKNKIQPGGGDNNIPNKKLIVSSIFGVTVLISSVLFGSVRI